MESRESLMQRGNAGPRLFSVGHSNHELPHFIDLLRAADVSAVADVRSSPFSRRLPQFNRPALEAGLSRGGIAYVYLGDLLGGRPGPRDLYDDEGRVDYERVRKTAFFQEGLLRLRRGTERYVLAMLCAEADPLDCHRGLMIAPALVEQGIAPLHLRKDGSVETTVEMEARLLKETGRADALLPTLFDPVPSDAERGLVLAEAYRLMARKKAFRMQTGDEWEE
jgi:uncharacterized protein (DUF488 family)